MKRRGILVWVCASFVATLVVGGERGVNVSNNAESPCDEPLNKVWNTCTSEAVANDLDRYFAEGEEFEIAAVRKAVDSDKFFIRGQPEKEAMWHVFVTLLLTDDVSRPDELLKFVCALQYRSLREAVRKELDSRDHSKEIRARLEEAATCRK